MATNDPTSRLAALFKATGEAHHQAFLEKDGHDPEWPAWYAEHLVDRLGHILGAKFTKSELICLLVTATNENAARAPGLDWTQYYARFFLKRYA